MKDLVEFAKTTILGGVVIILPVALLSLLVLKAIGFVRVVVDPLAAGLPGGPVAATIIAGAIIVLGCFATGALARTTLGERSFGLFERSVLERVPGYDFVRLLSRRALGREEGTRFAPALALFEGALVPAFVVEEHADGRFTVFVP